MSNIIEMIAEEGIEITANDTNKSLSIKNKCFLTDTQLETIRNGLSGLDKFMTESQVRALITLLSQGAENPNTAPEGIPKIFTSSGTFIIPKNGRYKFSLVGGGGSGSCGGNQSQYLSWNGTFQPGLDGSSTKISFGENVIEASGGHGATVDGPGRATIPYDGTQGACSGGKEGTNGESGAGNGGTASTDAEQLNPAGGGGGSPLNYNTPRMEAEKAKTNISSVAELNESPSPAVGYGAGGDGAHIYPDNIAGVGAGAGGSSGYLITEVLELENNANIDVTIGAGGAHVDNGDPSYHSGAGVNGAVLVEWVYQ